MGVTKWWTRGRKAIASATVLAIAVGTPVGIAILHKGFPITDVEMTSRDVWVTNGHDILAGRLNRQIEELDAAVAAATPALDVVQNGNSVFLFDTTAGSLERVDPAFTRLSERVDLPKAAIVRLGGTTLAILDEKKGSLWVVDVAGPLDFDPVDEPTLKLGKNAAVAVSSSGTVFATSPDDQKLYTIASAGAKPTSASITFSAGHQLAAVGESAVILDTDANKVVREDGSSVDLGSDKGIKLQQSGKDNSYAVVATGDSLLRVPLGGGSVDVGKTSIPRPITDADSVSSPVFLDGCAHGAWSGEQQYMLWCDGADPKLAAIDQPTDGDKLEFRVNKSVIALNNLSNGNVWLVDNEMRLVENWDEVTPPLEDDTVEGDEKSSTQSFEDTLAERTDVNRAPIARDDQFGARPGRTTVLPVIENDTDPDGDVLTITDTGDVDPSVGVLDRIDGGRALQFTPAPGASNASFSYRLDDGRGGLAEAFVTIRVVPESENNPPIEKRTTSVGVEVGGSVNYNVLTDWVDPDGDDLTLVGASPVSGDEARYTPDGFVTFQSKTAELGEKEIRLTVSDGTLTATGTFVVNVAAAGTLTPVGTPDFAEVFVGDTVIISPLDNDVAPGGGVPTLAGVDQVPTGATVSPNLERGTIGFSSPTAGTYYFLYSLAAGTQTSVGIVRVDVKPNPDTQIPPIAVKDTAYLRAGEPTTVKVLANDVSPTGLVLAIQSVDTTSTNGAVTVEVLNNTVIRISASAALTEQTQFTYTISDGAQTALAGVTIVPVAPIVNRQPPVAQADSISVRAGDFVSLDVLANDYHPDDAQVLLEPELADVTNAGVGALAFVNNQKVRYQAPDAPGEYSVIYRIADQYGESATATATFVVTPKVKDVNSNLPPVPEPQIARVFSGAKVLITVPLDGIDPDGDSVVVTKVTKAPTKGALSDNTPNSFVYTAFEGEAGTDVFYYEVEDTYGAKAIGQISIGVIPRNAVSDPPNAVDDAVEIKPGRTASVQVLANDSDPAGYELSVDEKLPEIDKGITADVEDNKVVIVAPDTEGAFTIRYGISNGHGGVDTAFIQVKITKDAQPQYPVATDYYVPIDDIVGHDFVDVPLKGLIANPGGRDSDLVVTVEGPNASSGKVQGDTQVIRVTPGKLRIAVAYKVTNEVDGLTGSAFIIVPPEVSASFAPPPYLDPSYKQPVIDMNSSGEWDLADFVIVPSGRPAIITSKSTVSALNSDGSSAYVDNNTIRFAPAKDFRGTTSVSFMVTDGKDADDINGNTALITFPITVGNPDYTDTPPSFTAQNRTVEAGEDATVIDLRASSNHPNPALISQFSYTDLKGTNDDIVASIDGGNLTVSSPFGVQPGTKTVLTFTVRFKDFEAPGSVTITTVSSTRPQAQAVEDDDQGRRGTVQPSYNVLDNDYNPFADKGQPLKVIDAYIENAASGATLTSWNAAGDVQVTAGPSFIGNVSVVYTVQDATKDPQREVQGRYILTVRDRPDKITPAPVATPGDHEATVTWATPAINGEPISGYTVLMQPGNVSVDLPSSAASYTATGLTNGTDYSFTVTATNVMGTSTPSDSSNLARPKGQATAPTTVTPSGSTNGSGQFTMSWSGAGANGGSITGYTWTVYQGASAVQSGSTSGATTASWVGTVGQSYTFKVKALATGGDSVDSASSIAAAPTPGAPAVSLSAPGGAGNYALNGSYTAPAANGVAGSAITYTWTINGVSPGSGSDAAVAPHSWTGSPSTGYTFSVIATVNGVSGPAGSHSATTPGTPPPPGYSANAAVGTCPEHANGAGTTGHFSSGPPASCSSAHGFVNGGITVYCYHYLNGNPWYEFDGDGYSRGEAWYVRGNTIDINGSPPGC